MKLEKLKIKIDNKILDSIINLDYNVIDKFNRNELTLELICIINEYAKEKVKEELKELKRIFYVSSGEDVEEYINNELINN
jgi:hypothetical protein|tara:strand:+ start:708 stop:950 length:243 start_codon:yes stop_codon:yes gene_type:complete